MDRVGTAVTAAANALGLFDKTTDAIKTTIRGAMSEQLLALKEADQNRSLQMRALGFNQIKELESIAAADRVSAFKMQMKNKSPLPDIVPVGVLSSFMGILTLMFFVPLPAENQDMIIYMVGQLSGFAGAAFAFWLDTMCQSECKTRLLAQAQRVK